jgi:predicted nucleotidyltransferase component of viral defense system
MLLHEETFRKSGGGPKVRLARHYYDLWCLINKKVAEKAMADLELFERVAAHRAVFFRKSNEAQETLRPGSLRLTPLPDQLPAWKHDYQSMSEAMFFGEVPAFEEILRVVGDFEKHFNKTN